jgi:catechol 2,3-dioxygenase-like lactoylglutathione lyase family enzyme
MGVIHLIRSIWRRSGGRSNDFDASSPEGGCVGSVVRVSFSHLDYNVVDLSRAVAFYDPLMHFLGFEKEADHPDWVLYNNGRMKLCLVHCEQRYADPPFHRKRPGLNHIALQVESAEDVDRTAQFLRERNIPILYDSPGQFHDTIRYYAVFFEDPFRLKLEVVYSPDYC